MGANWQIQTFRCKELIYHLTNITWFFIIVFTASEKRAFLLYYAVPLLSSFLPSEHLFFLMLLTGGIFRLLKQSISPEELDEACVYLKLFTAQAPVFYGKNNMYVCSVHSGDFFTC